MMRKLPQANPCPVPTACAARLRSRALKSIFWISLAFDLLPAATMPQALPDNPTPAPSDATWNRIEHLSDGKWIVVRTPSGVKVRCRFAGATDTCLYCDPPGPSLRQAGYHFDRASVVSVTESRLETSVHSGLLVAMAIVGTAVGVAATRNTDDKGAAAAGLLTAGFVGLVGYPIVEMQSQGAGFGFPYRPGAFSFGAPRLPGPQIRIRIPIGHPR